MSDPTITNNPVFVTPQTDHHLNMKTFWSLVKSAGQWILAINTIILANPQAVSFAAAKYLWIGPTVSAIGTLAEAISAQQAKKKRQLANNSGAPADESTSLDGLSTPTAATPADPSV